MSGCNRAVDIFSVMSAGAMVFELDNRRVESLPGNGEQRSETTRVKSSLSEKLHLDGCSPVPVPRRP